MCAYNSRLLQTFGLPSDKCLQSCAWDVHRNVRVKCPLLLSDFKQDWNILTKFIEIRQYQIS
jgi:hypothetical protein